MGYSKETQIYVATGKVYGGQNRMAPLMNMFLNRVTNDEFTSKEELDHFRKHVTSLTALDFLDCLKSYVFLITHGGNHSKLKLTIYSYHSKPKVLILFRYQTFIEIQAPKTCLSNNKRIYRAVDLLIYVYELYSNSFVLRIMNFQYA
ncbi:hypothetical protein GIB67_014224 [Kingdonia uniflora]|uniref:O-fucosyltransferase family protein n=1 Tax=Kingdonia uniflora TaxID=39325 RepID=A0A7J7M1W0_9MAGN|nr:hypothetical protein GIB67_014224 [Kingdonia uniflora]